MHALAGARSVNLFATPLLSHIWADAPELNPLLREAILAHEAGRPGEGRSNFGGWHSETGLLEFCSEAGRRLIGHMHAVVEEAARRLHAEFGRPPAPLNWVLSAWANVNRTGDYNQLHTHPGATWSGVYYVDSGDAAGDGAALQLYDPNPGRANLFFPELSTANVLFKPQPGLMVLFPSYVPHAVPPHRGTGTRISIAFNVRREPFP
ncbi:MAG TPA: TIGR02466 family protein [Stellaceae bacterium]|nr:TIGR02466 family protein [Stellaceae bacterium]